MEDVRLSPSFTLGRLTASYTATRLGIDNTPPAAVVEHLRTTAQYLEQIQTATGAELHLNDVYRCPALNVAVHGSPTSSHLEGYAADFTCPAYGPPGAVIQCIVTAGIPYDQLIFEGSWVHAGFDPRMRAELETAQWVNGRPTYTSGVAGVVVPTRIG